MLRNIRRLGATLLLGTLCTVVASPIAYGVGKKGLGNWMNDAQKNNAIGAEWWYNWGLDPKGTVTKAEFVPMEWSYTNNNDREFVTALDKAIAENHPKFLLGFNEPDGQEQANMTVAQALEAWPLLMKTGLPLGSPAAVNADGKWMKEFMAGVAEKGYRVDFICVHWYSISAQELLSYVDKIHNLYGKPVWITEFCPVDWSGKGRVTPESAAEFVKIALPELNKRPYVQRYAWFPTSPTDKHYGKGALFNDDGTLTIVGKAYAEQPGK